MIQCGGSYILKGEYFQYRFDKLYCCENIEMILWFKNYWGFGVFVHNHYNDSDFDCYLYHNELSSWLSFIVVFSVIMQEIGELTWFFSFTIVSPFVDNLFSLLLLVSVLGGAINRSSVVVVLYFSRVISGGKGYLDGNNDVRMTSTSSP